MYKKVVFLLLLLVTTIASASIQQKSSQIFLNINFDWKHKQENGDSKQHISNIHLNKTITLDSNQKDYQIAFEKSEMMGKLPVTLVLLIKPMKVTSKTADFQFGVLEYGFSEGGTIWTQPRLTLLNGKSSKIIFPIQANPHMNLKLSGKWL